jgi:hypothetical protein
MHIILLFALLSITQNKSQPPIDPHWLFVRNPITWKSPPRSSGAGYLYTDNADIAVFFPTGDFALVSCVLYRDKRTGALSVIPNEGYTIQKGSWEKGAGNSLTVRTRYVYMSASVREVSTPSPEVRERWLVSGKSYQRIGGVLEHRKEHLQGPAAALRTRPGKYTPLAHLANTDTLSGILSEAPSK